MQSMHMMIRTQVYLPDDLYKALKLEAKTGGILFSHLIRAGVRKELASRKKAKIKGVWGKGFIGAGKGGPKDLSSKIDYYLYGGGSKFSK